VLLERQRPDVILMDLHLPGLDVVSLSHRLRASPHWAAIPIVMTTGDACKAALLRSLEVGAICSVPSRPWRCTIAHCIHWLLRHGYFFGLCQRDKSPNADSLADAPAH